MDKFRIGVVGGSGYIGSAIAGYLNKTFEVRVVDKAPIPKGLEGKVDYEKCDIRKYQEVERALNGLNFVVHTAIIQIPLIVEKKELSYNVNLLGTQNVCRAVEHSPSIRGMVLTGTWHVFGERELIGTIDEAFGFRPDQVEDRARLYALSKIAQEVIVRYYDEMSQKTYGLIRLATVLGEGMPKKTAANIFISKGLAGESITPFKHSMYRPMLYVDINDVCEAFRTFAMKTLKEEIRKEENSLTHVFNLCWAKPITIVELAHIIRNTIIKLTGGRIRPKIEIVDQNLPALYQATDKQKMKVDNSKVRRLLGMKKLKDPQESIERIIKRALQKKKI